jgi:uncharacterized membrane protein
MRGSHVSGLIRVLWAFAAGGLAFAIAIFLIPWQVATLIGWSVTAAVFIAWVWLSVWHMDGAATADHATIEDLSRPAADLILLVASTASLVGVALALLEAAGEHGAAKALTTAVASLSAVLSWAAVHTVFTLRYASLYYVEDGGIDFNDDRRPDYGDFAYFAFTVGMTYQVSDTAITAKVIRMTALRHALLSFLFGTGVVALMINVVAQLLFNK